MPRPCRSSSVEPDMRVAGHPEIFAVGDLAASVAGEPTEPMAYKDKGTMATIGRSAAVAQLPLRVRPTGRVAWAGWPGRLNVIVGDPP